MERLSASSGANNSSSELVCRLEQLRTCCMSTAAICGRRGRGELLVLRETSSREGRLLRRRHIINATSNRMSTTEIAAAIPAAITNGGFRGELEFCVVGTPGSACGDEVELDEVEPDEVTLDEVD